jgi:CRISPR-associated protein Cas5d
MPNSLTIRVWGEFALFTRPELKVERLSYPIMTPSAARGILDAIMYRPQMAWHIRSITAIEPCTFPDSFPADSRELPYRLMGVRRNEIIDKIAPRTVDSWMKSPQTYRPYLVDSAGRDGAQGSHRTQRNSLILQHVAYLIDATPVLTDRANQSRRVAEDDEDKGPDTVAKYVAMCERRVRKGQCFHRPYLGCREFACDFSLPSGLEQPLTNWSESLGLMFYDMKYAPQETQRPGFFHATINRGVLHCDTKDAGTNGEPPIQILGW